MYSSSCNNVPQVVELQQYGTMAMLRRHPASILVKVIKKHRARVATVREKCLENNFFCQVREKSAHFVDGQGNLERTRKVREKSGNLKINSYDSLQKIYLFCSKGERMYFLMRLSIG